jgi:hypothetical protein
MALAILLSLPASAVLLVLLRGYYAVHAGASTQGHPE